MRQGLDAGIGYAVKRLQQALRAAGDRALRPVGLTMSQYAVLAVLADGSAASNSELARRTFVTRQTTNELLAGLLRAGLVSRADQNGRALPVRLSDDGRELCDRGARALAGIEELMTSGLGESRRQLLLELLLTCAGNLEGAALPPRKPGLLVNRPTTPQ